MQANGVTIDVDWAPDVAIDHVAQLLVDRGVPATWFVTHSSPALDRLRDRPDLFELGIHPNFLDGSTHGETHEQVLAHCLELVPDAISMRTHSLYQSTPLFALVLHSTPIEVDSSMLLMHARGLEPATFAWEGRTLVRLPFWWEDDLVMEEDDPRWELDAGALDDPGVKLYDFHPIHVYLNSSAIHPYRTLCREHTLSTCDERALAPFVQAGTGAGTLFVELLDELAARGDGVRVGDFGAAAAAS